MRIICAHNCISARLLAYKDMMPLEQPFEGIFTEMMGGLFSPAQQRFFAGLKGLYFSQGHGTFLHEVAELVCVSGRRAGNPG